MSLGAVRAGEAGAELTCVPRQLPADSDVALSGFQVVDGADVVQAPTGHVIARGSIGTGHDPGGPQGDGVHLQRHSPAQSTQPPLPGLTTHHIHLTALYTPTAPAVTDSSTICRAHLHIFSTLFHSKAIVSLNT